MHHRSFLFCGILIAFLGAGFAPTSAWGQTDATLRIVVTSAEDGSPLQGANVILSSLDTGEIAEAGATDRDGLLEMTGLTPGRYSIQISYLGFETHRDTLALQAERRIYSTALAVKPGQLEEVTVQGRRGVTQRQAGLQTIHSSDLERIPTPGPGGDLASYLQTLPGVVSVGDKGGQLYIQGGAPSQNRYLIDGLPVVQPFHISSFYSAFPQSIVQSVDLYAGGFGAEYGEALSSVLDVRLRPGNMKEYNGSTALGPHLASVNVEGPIVRGQQSFLASARYSLIDETAGPLFGKDADLGFYDLTGRYSFQQENATCNVTAMRTHDRGSIGPQQNRQLSWSNTVIGGRCLILDEQFGHTFSVRGGYTGFQNSMGAVGSPQQRASRWQAYLILNQDQTFLGQHVDFGGRIAVGQYNAEIDEQFVGIETLSQYQDLVRVHGSIDWTVNDYLTLTPGIAGQVTLSLNPTFDPRLRLSIRPDGTDQQEISLATGIYHQIDEAVTDQRDTGTVFSVWQAPDREAPLPRALHAIVSYRQRIGSSFEASVEGYAKRLENIPVSKWTPEAGLNTETALANGIAHGANARIEFRRGPLYLYTGYAWSTVTYEATTEDLGAWVDGALFSYAPPHDRRHQVNAVSSYKFGGVTASVSWEFGSGRPYTRIYGFDLSLEIPQEEPTRDPGTAHTLYERPYGSRLPVYHRLDVALERSFDLSDNLALNTKLGAINLYDRPNIFYYDVSTLQRVNQSPLLPYFSLQFQLD